MKRAGRRQARPGPASNPARPLTAARKRLKLPPDPRQEKRLAALRASRPYQPREPMMTVTLRTQHSINGVPYGPGRLRVPEELGRTLMEGETRVRQSEAELFGQQRSFMLNMRTMQAIPVASQIFDHVWQDPTPVPGFFGRERG